MEDTKPLVIYHANCADGFASVWAAHRKFGKNVECLPANYGEPPPPHSLLHGRDVYIVDFSYKRDVLTAMVQVCNRVVVLDHHKSAQQELEGLVAPGLSITFDMDKSGGRLAWEYFHPGTPIPWLVAYTEDRDLWRWKLDRSKEVSAAIASYPHGFALWDYWHGSWGSTGVLMEEGKAILRYQQQQVDAQVKHAREIDLDGHKILAVNATLLISEIAGKLAEGRPFGACWFARADGKVQWSLRSTDAGLDVSEIARKRGGGGHRNAAGFEE